MPLTRRSLLAASLAAFVAGCDRAKPPTAASVVVDPPPPPPPKPYLLHLPGVSGESVVDHTLVDGLRLGFARDGLDVDIEIYDWTEHDPGVPALQAYARNRTEAQLIAQRLADHVRPDPRRTVYVTSHSGGAGPLAWSLEALPPDVSVTSVLFLAPALSPGYDLSNALSHVRRDACVFWSDHDTVVLSAGTRVFGTIDRVYADAAGYTGFRTPQAADRAQYAKLRQFPYDPRWSRLYHLGDHIGCTSTPFARDVLAPLLEGKPLPTTWPAVRPATQATGAT